MSGKVRHPDLPLILLVLVCLVLGLFIFLDYGLSRDEPLFYAYADALGYAYSIPEWLSGDFDVEQAYGPSAADHKIYGPAYLLIARNPVRLLSLVTTIRTPEIWHLANFATFLAGGVLLYFLCKRWMSSLAAFGAALLFITQPVLWGHAFINPKDIPFMVFILAALTLGLRMVDRLVLLTPPEISPAEANYPAGTRRSSRRVWLITSLLLLIFLLFLLLFDAVLRQGLSSLIRDAYDAPSTSLFGRAFDALAANPADVSVEAYVAKGLVQFERLRLALLALGIPLLLISTAAAFRPLFVNNFLDGLRNILSPLPSRPSWWIKGQDLSKTFRVILIPGFLLGLVMSIRITGPLAGLLVLLYFLLRSERRSLAAVGLYGLVALVLNYLTWPFLWDAPLRRYVEVVRHMASNPHIISVLYNGEIFPSNGLPFSYLPVMLGITLTLPALALFLIGLVGAIEKTAARKIDWRSLSIVLLLFFIFVFYVMLLSPPMYDGYRHFLFILPPLFVLAGLGMQVIFNYLKSDWLRGAFLFLVSAAGIYGLISHHPYQYTYYNALVGGTSGAYRRFETDYWLTCYKEAMQDHINPNPAQYSTIHVTYAPEIADYYAAPQVNVIGYDPALDQPVPRQKTLLTTRTNVDLSLLPEASSLFSVGLQSADFCVVKQSR